MQLDTRQKRAVDVRTNAVVTAGAGSGKTRVLAERYLRLVRDERVPVEEILTLTFTRKAAAEMYERIYRSLAEYRSDPFIAGQLAHFENAQISTLDSFCAQIARNGCTRYGVPTAFRVDEDEVDRLAEETSLAFLLDNHRNPVLSRFIAVNGFRSVWQDGFAELARSYAVVSRERRTEAALEAQLAELGRLYRERIGELDAAVGTLRELEPAVKAISKAQDAFEDYGLDPDWDPRSASGPPEGMAQLSEATGRIDKRTGGSKAEAVDTYKECVERIRRVVGELEDLAGTAEVREELRELYRLVDEFEANVNGEKRRRGLLSYRDVMELAVDLLRTDPRLRSYYNRRFRFIMIDEFQDNNELQKRLLYLLSLADSSHVASTPLDTDGVAAVTAAHLDSGKLFFVGDEKQSIYRFRGADVSVFKQLSAEIADAGGKALELPFNYRSRRTLIEFFNLVFASVMADASASYEARFTPLAAPEDTAGGGGEEDAPERGYTEPEIRIAYKPYEEQAPGEHMLGQDEAEAYYVAKAISEAVREKRWVVQEEGQRRAAGFDDVAILMRSTSNQRHYERMLRLFDVPYTTQSVRSLYESALAYDVYHVLQLCVHPEDRAAYAAVLRSPLVSVSDEALSAVLLDHRAPFALDENDARGMLSEADVAKYERGAYMYRELREAVDEEPITRIVSRLWHQFGYRYRLLASPSLHPYLEYFDHLWELARTMDNRPVVEFVDAMRDHLGEYARRPELEVLRDEAPGVQLLTIHKAKGLEFPVVVLANTGNVGRNDGLGKQPFYLSEQFGLTANMSSASARLSKPDRVNYFFTVGQEENAGMELAELKRLLYVALTRAESHILISGVFNRNNRSTDRHLLYHVLSALNLDPQQQRIGRLDSDIDVEVDLIPDVPRSVLSGFGEAPRGPTPTEVLSAYRAAEPVERGSVEREITVTELAERYHEAARAADAEVAARDGGAGAADEELPAVRCEELLEERGLAPFFGSLTHYLIEASLEAGAPGSGAPATGAPPPAELPPGLRREAHRGEVTEEEYLRMAHDAEALATGFLRSPVAARLHGARIESEVPFVLYRSIGETPAWIRGQIDFLADFGGPDGEVLVLDFKTDRRYRPHAHRLQLSLYREAAAELTARGAGPEEQLTRRTVRALVYYLRDGRVEEVEDAPELSEALLGASNTR